MSSNEPNRVEGRITEVRQAISKKGAGAYRRKRAMSAANGVFEADHLATAVFVGPMNPTSRIETACRNVSFRVVVSAKRDWSPARRGVLDPLCAKVRQPISPQEMGRVVGSGPQQAPLRPDNVIIEILTGGGTDVHSSTLIAH